MTAPGLDAAFRIPDEVIFRELDGEAVVLNLDTGIYFGLDAVGTDIWRAIVAAATLDDALGQVQAEYDVEPGTLRTDFLRLVDQLLAKGLLQRAD